MRRNPEKTPPDDLRARLDARFRGPLMSFFRIRFIEHDSESSEAFEAWIGDPRNDRLTI